MVQNALTIVPLCVASSHHKTAPAPKKVHGKNKSLFALFKTVKVMWVCVMLALKQDRRLVWIQISEQFVIQTVNLSSHLLQLYSRSTELNSAGLCLTSNCH